jgi:Protein of unknown function (DUF1553)/Protein of unknown function (DUF1549)/Planctomycete cytochrome C
MKRILFALCALLIAGPAFAQDKAAQLEFFEKKVRPVLVQHCYECHSAKAKRVRGGLLLDSRSGMLEGGDLGPAIVPGDPAKSRLIEAIRYMNVDLKMPKAGKLSDAVIADLTAWLKMGAPWPDEKVAKKAGDRQFNLAKRKREHWCWQPIKLVSPPEIKDKAWAHTAVDRFLLAKLEAKGLNPAPPADPRTLLRRLYFDIVGLPPSRDEVEKFVAAWDAAGAKRGKLVEDVVDKLLASPQFGERWGRHWLDLVRYAESRGHEFDYTIPNAYQYRDYVIRAINADVPFNQFVGEHVAGDLLKDPRLHPKDGFNESIIGTAFWFLGEEVHSPVDIRQDQADRFDNRIDVMTKTFLGLTVACARCHDHKFDAISTKDYYALFGVLESSNYRQARFDTITHNRKNAEEIWALREKSSGPLKKAFALAVAETQKKVDAYLLTAAGIEDRAKELDPTILKHWRQALAKALKDETSPLHALANAGANPKRLKEILEPFLKRVRLDENAVRAYEDWVDKADVIVNYSSPTAPWMPDDMTFGPRPVRPGDIILGETPLRPIARIVGRGALERDRTFDKINLPSGAQKEEGSLSGIARAGRTMRTPEFTLNHSHVYVAAKGSGMIYAAVGQHTMIAGPLHGGLVQRFKTGDKTQWIAINLEAYKGQRLHLEFTFEAKADFAVELAVQSSKKPPPLPADPHFDRVVNWMIQNPELFIVYDSDEARKLVSVAAPILEQHKKLLDQIKLESRLAPAMQDGSGTDEFVFTRGNPKTLGDVVPRRFLEAFVGPQPLRIKTGSGRLEIAEQMTDPVITPLITRVYVNRVWHHLFGRGIVGSVDNFGVLGEMPTHPELLDYLAERFAKDGWSTKKMIRTLVLTRAYQMSSAPDENADQADPQNLLLHRMRFRRLEGEAIRDSILKVSGRLNSTMYGPSVPVFLTPFQDGRGRPGSGPLDGDGRRSIYLAVRRNFLSSFLLAFDTPTPFSTVGKRTNSNVPAQALILMNDPFVHGQAELWAKRVLAEKLSDEDRMQGMYLDAFSRPPTEVESRACTAFLGPTPDARRWADLAHVLMNTKEFYFVN